MIYANSNILDSIPTWAVKDGSPQGGKIQFIWGKSVNVLNWSYVFLI